MEKKIVNGTAMKAYVDLMYGALTERERHNAAILIRNTAQNLVDRYAEERIKDGERQMHENGYD